MTLGPIGSRRRVPAGQDPEAEGSLWHMFRRVWATRRKQVPPMDVAAAGGWLDIGTLQQCYQQCDDGTLRLVVKFERPRTAPTNWRVRVTK